MPVGKRSVDLVLSALALLVLWPVVGVIALLIKTEDGGPVFFRQTRVGLHGRLFCIWKFRTMVPDAPSVGSPLTVGADARVTRVGAWLRRLKLDELPQLANVLRGEMSLVGPRPELSCYVALYTPAQRRVLDLVPGVTGEAQIRYRNESEILGHLPDAERAYVERIMPEKIEISLAYAARATIWTDLAVIVQTLHQVFRREPAHADL